MRSRETLLELFSTFADVEGDRIRQWLPEPRLRRNMQRRLEASDSPDAGLAENGWALYWYKTWQAQAQALEQTQSPVVKPSIVQQHLAAYLQESCYWAAHKTVQRFPQLEFTLADYFQLSSGETPRVLKGFNATVGTSLKSYALIVLINFLKDYLRQRRAVDVCSDTALLRKMSQKRVTEALQAAGVSPVEQEDYCFTWLCFKRIDAPTEPSSDTDSKSLSTSPNEAIATLYNTKRPNKTSPSLTAEQVEQRLTKLTRWIRAYLYPAIDSLNRTKPGQEQGELQDDLTDEQSETPLESAIAIETLQERQQQRSQLHDRLQQALQSLDSTAQKILQLFYAENLSQMELADRMAMSQPTVSRRLKKAEETLLQNLLTDIQANLNKQPDPTELKHISLALKEWLVAYYQQPMTAGSSR
jgi:RNA polymerase sigma factor (sigma-70 family)